MSAVLLHLSDIHIKTSHDPILKRGKEIAATLYSSLPNATHVFVVISGDIAYSGRKEEYEWAADLFGNIENFIKAEKDCPVSFILAPGNHDCDFTNANSARKVVVETLEKQELPEIDDSIVNLCTEIQTNFFEFREMIENNADVTDDKLWRRSRFEVEQKSIEFDSLNISWVSKLKEEPGKLYFPVNKYSQNESLDSDIRITVIHHPLNWFSQNTYRPFRTFIRKISNIVISGHEHQGNVGVITEAESDASAFVEGCVLQSSGKDLTNSSFNVVILDLQLAQFSSTKYIWNGSNYSSMEEGSWSDYHDLPAKRTNPFSITTEFETLIEDPGAYFKHPAKADVGLSDVFVYPDLKKIGNGEDRRRVFISSSRLLAPEVSADGILIEGEEKSGKTSLLFQLYRQYHDRGFVPLYLKGKDLKRVNESDIDTLIQKSIEHQYGLQKVENFLQLPNTQKVLLLDDFEDSPMRAANSRAGLLCSLRKRFGHVVVTVNEMFEMRELLEGDESRGLASLTHYKMQPFGHALREQLIKRWLSLGADGTIDESTSLARLDQAEKLMNAVMQKAVIPSAPLYLLTLLQSIDAGRSGAFKESALGYYYEYLLTEAFQNAGVKPDKLTEHYQYSAYLAWEFHRKGSRELTEADLRDFNSRFSKDWHTVDFTHRLDVLIKARVLCKVGEDYAFRYPYVYYYLKGQYLSENLDDLDIRAYIGHCCKHLYVRDHANTVLFLAHHTTDDFVLKSIAEALHNLFRGRSPIKFDGDIGEITKLIDDAPRLVYSGDTPVQHRTNRNKLRDRMDDGHDGLSEQEEASDDLSLIAQMTMLSKTTEILGQVLKNQYSKIQRPRKAELLEDLFNGPLRALRDFYEFFEKNPNALVFEIEAALKRKGKIESEEERKTIARKVVASLIQIITVGFLMRAAQSANSESLLEDVRGLVAKNNTPAFRIIEAGMLLDTPKAIPRTLLKNLIKDVEKDMVASRVVRIMVLNRLYMFKTTEQDMQWISKEVGIDLGVQHAITYQEKQQRI